MTGDKLTSGMLVSEAMRRAEEWWGVHRHSINREFTTLKDRDRIRSGGKAPLMVFKGDVTEDRSVGGILRGAPWEELDRDEKLAVVRTWHEEQVVRPGLGDYAENRRLTLAKPN